MNNELLNEVTFFVLAIFVGIEVISKVPTILHTPLMSGTNAIHGIILVGAIVIAAGASTPINIAIGLGIGTVVGVVGARRVKMTAIPQMVALFNGVGGGAAALVAVAELLRFGEHPGFTVAFPSVFSIVIGSVSFAGSLIAFAKLQELMTGTPITYPGQQLVNGLLAAAIIGFVIAVLAIASVPFSFVSLMVLALVLGVAFVLPIGGAGIPVVDSLLNTV